MGDEHRSRIPAPFMFGLSLGIVLALAKAICDLAGEILPAKFFQTTILIFYLIASAIAIGKDCGWGKSIITDKVDLFLLGIVSGISGIQLLLSGLTS